MLTEHVRRIAADTYTFEPTDGSPQSVQMLVVSRRTGEIILTSECVSVKALQALMSMHT